MGKYILALDQGTSSCRSFLVDSLGKVVFSIQKEIPLSHPKSGWAEQDAEKIWEVQLETILELFDNPKFTAKEVVSIGITNQRETAVAWDKETGRAISKAISWQDKRTRLICENLKNDNFSKEIQNKTGLVIDTYFSASKMQWIMENNTAVQNHAAEGNLCMGTMDAFLLYKLTNGKSFYTEVSNASRTMLYDINKLQWSSKLLEKFKIKEEFLPEVLDSDSNFGETDILGVKIPINAILGDQQAALFGQGCYERGMLKCTLGTGAFILLNTGSKIIPSKNGLLSTIAWKIEGKSTYALEGSVFIAGAVMQWLRDDLKLLDKTENSSDIATKTKNSDLYFVPAFSGLGTPHWDMDAKGLMTGISRDTNGADIIKASLESIAYQCYDVFEAMKEDISEKLEAIFFDGGASNNEYLMQFQSDLLQREIKKANQIESTVVGVAYLSGLNSGLWNWEDLKNFSTRKSNYAPKIDEATKKQLIEGWQRAVSKTMYNN